jgi:hypothetical protein
LKPSKPKYESYLYLALAISSITLGPGLMVFRADEASFWEKWIYVTLFIPLGLFVMRLNYTREETQALANDDQEVRKSLIVRIRAKYLKYLWFYIPIALGYAGLCMWVLGRGGF